MNIRSYFRLSALLLALPSLIWASSEYPRPFEPDPTRWQEQIDEFEEEDAANMLPRGEIVVVGSSSIRMWRDRMANDLAPFTVIPRGFGGSHMSDVIYYADELITKYAPRAVVLYEGENDIASGKSPEYVLEDFRFLLNQVRSELPDVRFYVISPKPSIRRWEIWDKMTAAGELLAAECAGDPNLYFIDVGPAMLNEDGVPKPDIFIKDNLHMNDAGYDIWASLVQPVLVAHEGSVQGSQTFGESPSRPAPVRSRRSAGTTYR